MTLTPGTRIGGYDVVAPIGAGGMGEVYRATDAKLKRQVALKVLPASVAADSDRLARFRREAEVPGTWEIYAVSQRVGREMDDLDWRWR